MLKVRFGRGLAISSMAPHQPHLARHSHSQGEQLGSVNDPIPNIFISPPMYGPRTSSARCPGLEGSPPKAHTTRQATAPR